ncbi:MAG: peptidyl-prolyl cis-trans isomerase [Planctomycetes bacterium]|nr:peptidyl-prolyl cis-trans isomerase [Planctomycetota bacterium]
MVPVLLLLLQSAPASSPAADFSLARETPRPVARVFDRDVTVGEVLDRVERRWWPGLAADLAGPYGWFHIHSPLFDRWVSDHVDLLLLEKEAPQVLASDEEVTAEARRRIQPEMEKLRREGRRTDPEIEAALLDRRRKQDGISIERDLRLEKSLAPLTADALRGHFYRSALNYGGRVRAAHLFFQTTDPKTLARLPLARREEAKRRAEEAKRRADAGEDFAELARTLSEDPATLERGGDLGFFPRTGRVPEEVARAAFAGHPGEILGPVESERGYHVLRILDRRTARHPDFNSVRGEVGEDLRRERRRERILDLRRAGGVLIY